MLVEKAKSIGQTSEGRPSQTADTTTLSLLVLELISRVWQFETFDIAVKAHGSM